MPGWGKRHTYEKFAQKARREDRRRRLALVFASVLLAACTGLGGYYWAGHRTDGLVRQHAMDAASDPTRSDRERRLAISRLYSLARREVYTLRDIRDDEREPIELREFVGGIVKRYENAATEPLPSWWKEPK